MKDNKISLTKRRILLVQIFYRYILMNNSSDYILQDLLDETQVKLDESTIEIAKEITSKLEELNNDSINNLNQDWKWDRIPALIKSILIVGIYEIKYTKTPKAVTINEMVNICKEFEPDFDFKFVNAILDKINKI